MRPRPFLRDGTIIPLGAFDLLHPIGRGGMAEVWRGVHNLQAEVLDETGQMLIRSRTNRFYVQQTTVR